MAELFIELFSEEIPSQLQINARKKIKLLLEEKQKPTAIFLHHPPFKVCTSIRSFFEYEN